jgi:N-acetylglutamate synthase-like GNAT family acetyltransferase
MWREITDFRSTRQGGGDGTALLARVCREADAKGVGLVLLADDDRLAAWYERHGFARLPGDARLMARAAHGNSI